MYGLVYYSNPFYAKKLRRLYDWAVSSNISVFMAALRRPNTAAWYKEWNYGTFTEGATYIWLGSHHVGHRPTF